MTFPAKRSAFLALAACGAVAVLLAAGCGNSISDTSNPTRAAVQASALSTATPPVTTQLTTVVPPPAGGPVRAGFVPRSFTVHRDRR